MTSLHSHRPDVALDSDELAFFARLGANIAQLRKEQRMTQQQLAELLDVSQQTITAYEVGRRRIQVSSLPVIAQALGVSIEELIGAPAKAKKRGPTSKLQQQVAAITQLPRARQQFIIQVIDSMLAQRP